MLGSLLTKLGDAPTSTGGLFNHTFTKMANFIHYPGKEPVNLDKVNFIRLYREADGDFAIGFNLIPTIAMPVRFDDKAFQLGTHNTNLMWIFETEEERNEVYNRIISKFTLKAY